MISILHFLLELNSFDYAWFPPVTLILPRDWIIPPVGWLNLIAPLTDNKQGQKGNI